MFSTTLRIQDADFGEHFCERAAEVPIFGAQFRVSREAIQEAAQRSTAWMSFDDHAAYQMTEHRYVERAQRMRP